MLGRVAVVAALCLRVANSWNLVLSLDHPYASWTVALGLGLLIGVERERRKGEGPGRGSAGLRTFAMTLMHPLRVLMQQKTKISGWVMGCGDLKVHGETLINVGGQSGDAYSMLLKKSSLPAGSE